MVGQPSAEPYMSHHVLPNWDFTTMSFITLVENFGLRLIYHKNFI